MLQKPIITAKFKKNSENDYSLIGGIEQIKKVNKEDHRILKNMRGFKTFSEIAEVCQCDIARISEVYERYRGLNFLCLLPDWNKLKWCNNCEVYINKNISNCSHCGTVIENVNISPPCDPIFSLGEEYNFIHTIIEKKLGFKIKGEPFYLTNNGVYNNVFFWEIVLEGKIILKIIFKDWDKEKWEYDFSPDFFSIKWDKMFAALEDERNKQIEANSQFLNELTEDTIALIKEIFLLLNPSKDNLPLIYFSGGKESSVMFDLFKKGGIKCQLLSATTGFDFSDDINHIHELSKDLNYLAGNPIHIELADTNKAFVLMKLKGKLDTNDMWCRSEIKYPVRNRGVEKLFKGKNYIAFEGSRNYENDFRREHPIINLVTNIDGYSNNKQVWIHPLAKWNGFDIWSYLFSNKIKINPLYFKGFQRTTCWICPLVNPFHMAQSKKHCKNLWAQIDNFEQPKDLKGFSQWKNPY